MSFFLAHTLFILFIEDHGDDDTKILRQTRIKVNKRETIKLIKKIQDKNNDQIEEMVWNDFKIYNDTYCGLINRNIEQENIKYEIDATSNNTRKRKKNLYNFQI